MSRRFLPPLLTRALSLVDVDRALRSIDERIRQIVSVPILDGVLLRDVDASGATTVIHGLGRTPVGVFVVRSSVQTDFLIDDFAKTTLLINPSSASTVSLWVF